MCRYNERMIKRYGWMARVSLVIATVVVPKLAYAQVVIRNPLQFDEFNELVSEVTTYFMIIGATVAPIMFLIGAVMFMTAGGNPEQINKAKSLMLWTAVGFGIILLASGFVVILQNLLLGE